MQHNENDSDQAARLHAFLIAAKFKLENLMNEERFKFLKEFEERGINQPALKGKAQLDASFEYDVIISLYEQFKHFLENIKTISFEAIHQELNKSLEILSKLDAQNKQSKELMIELSRAATFAKEYLTSAAPNSSSKILDKLEPRQPRKKIRAPINMPESKAAEPKPKAEAGPAPILPARKAKQQTPDVKPVIPNVPPKDLTDPEILSLHKFITNSIQSLGAYTESRKLKVNQIEPSLLQRGNDSYESYKAKLTKEKYDVMRDLVENLSELSQQLNNKSNYIESLAQIQAFISETESDLRTSLRRANTGVWTFKKGESEQLIENLKMMTDELINRYKQSDEVKSTKDKVSDFKPHSQF